MAARPRPVGRPRKGAPKRPVARTSSMAYHDAGRAGGGAPYDSLMPEGDVLGMRDRHRGHDP